MELVIDVLHIFSINFLKNVFLMNIKTINLFGTATRSNITFQTTSSSQLMVSTDLVNLIQSSIDPMKLIIRTDHGPESSF